MLDSALRTFEIPGLPLLRVRRPIYCAILLWNAGLRWYDLGSFLSDVLIKILFARICSSCLLDKTKLVLLDWGDCGLRLRDDDRLVLPVLPAAFKRYD